MSSLPREEELEIDSCLADAIEDYDYVEETINNYLSNKYGYCVAHYDWGLNIEGSSIFISNIEWDATK